MDKKNSIFHSLEYATMRLALARADGDSGEIVKWAEHVDAIWTGDEHDMCVFIRADWDHVHAMLRAAERRTQRADGDHIPMCVKMEKVGNVHPSQSRYLAIDRRTVNELT